MLSLWRTKSPRPFFNQNVNLSTFPKVVANNMLRPYFGNIWNSHKKNWWVKPLQESIVVGVFLKCHGLIAKLKIWWQANGEKPFYFKKNLDNLSFFHSVPPLQCGMIPLGREALSFRFDNAVMPSSNSTIEKRSEFPNLVISFSQFISEVEHPMIFIFLIPLCAPIS